jgi:hypothetical protein
MDVKAWVIYESIFGNTKRVAEAIGEGLAGNFDVDLFEVGSANNNPEGVDLVVVGGPTHMLSMSRPSTRRMGREQAAKQNVRPISAGPGIREWLDDLRHARGMAAATFDTGAGKMGLFSGGSAAKGAAKRLARKGYRMIARPEQFLIASDNERQFLRDGEHLAAKATH